MNFAYWMFKQLLGDPNTRKLKRFSPLVTDINILEEDVSVLTDEDLRRKTYDFQEKLNKINILEKQIEFLDELLPEAFAVVKETSRRLAQNKQLKVTARDFDKDLASEFDFVTIDGDQAIWSNKWLAFGAEQIWNMVHYDVQLIMYLIQN